MAITGTIAAVASLGYGIYSNIEAANTQKKEYNDSVNNANTNAANQAAMLQQQMQQQAALAAQQLQEQQAAQAANQSAQQTALANAQSQIPVIQGQLSQSLANSEQQSMTQQEPLIEGRLNALGLLQSGALPAQQAVYQAQLASQAQTDLANYGTSANQAIQNQALAYTGQDSANLQQDLQTTLNNQQSALNQQFSSQDTAYTNNVAEQQYLANLQASQTASQQAAANQYINLGGQIGQGALSYFGRSSQPNTSPAIPTSNSTPYNGDAYFSPSTSYSSGGYPSTTVPSGSIFGDLTGQTSSPTQSYGMFDANGNYIPNPSQPAGYTPYTGGV